MGFFKEYWKGGEGQTEAAFHSSSFHSYFEGYIEKKQIDPATGKSKIVRIYAAPYYVRSSTNADWIKVKLRATLLFLLSASLLILSSSIFELEDPAKYYQIFVAGGLICEFFLLYVFLKFLSAPRKMTIGTYRAVCPTMYRLCLASAVFIFCAIPARLVNAVLLQSRVSVSLLLGFACLAVSGASMLGLFFLEKKVVYTIEDNEHADENGFQIQR